MIISEGDFQSKSEYLEFIEPFFKDLDVKVDFLSELYKAGHQDEARVLCSCYIDWFASALYLGSNNFNFVRVLKEHGGEEIFSYVHPKMLEEALLKKAESGKKWEIICEKISQSLKGAQGKLYEEQEMIDQLSPLVKNSEIEDIKKELWRGTYAAIIYKEWRIPSAHGFGPLRTSFAYSKFKGQPLPDITFEMLLKPLKRIKCMAKELSMTSGKLFGRDDDC